MCETLPRPCMQCSHLARLPPHCLHKPMFWANILANATHDKSIAQNTPLLFRCAPKPNMIVDALSLFLSKMFHKMFLSSASKNSGANNLGFPVRVLLKIMIFLFSFVLMSHVGGSLVGVWNGWGYGIPFLRALNF